MIGFKNTNSKLELVEPQVQSNLPNVEDLIKMKGMQEVQKLVHQYFNHAYPLLNPEERDLLFTKQLRKIKERYFDKI